MNLLAALLVVVRYTLHNVKTFILVIYCVVLRISFANCIFLANCIIVLLGLLMLPQNPTLANPLLLYGLYFM